MDQRKCGHKILFLGSRVLITSPYWEEWPALIYIFEKVSTAGEPRTKQPLQLYSGNPGTKGNCSWINSPMSQAKIALVMVWPQQLLVLPESEHGRIIFWLDSISILYISLSISLILPLRNPQGYTLNLHTPSEWTLFITACITGSVY